MVQNMIQPQDKTLLLVDDDKPFLTRLARAMETRGFVGAHGRHRGRRHCRSKISSTGLCCGGFAPGRWQWLDVIEALHAARPEARVVVLTGYGNIATAVTAVKLGAIDYLAKPADADAVYGALMSETRRSAQRLAGKPDVS